MKEAETWDRLSSRYDRVVGLFDRSYPRVRELLRRDLAGREHVLEVAAGTGQFTFDLAQVAGRVTATDVSPEMVSRLDVRLRDQGVKNVETAVMNACELEVPDQSLDAIFCANALHVMESPLTAMGEFKRALRRSGRLVVPTFCHGVNWSRRLLSALLSLVSPFVAYTKFSPDSLRELVASAGFEPAESTVLPGMFPVAYLVADAPG